ARCCGSWRSSPSPSGSPDSLRPEPRAASTAGSSIMELGVALSSEELAPAAIVRAAVRAEEVGFGTAWVSDHFLPWIDAQGESPCVWSVLGAIANVTDRIRVGTGVTCPIMRVHPAIVAQAAATTQWLFEGRFRFG